MTAQAPHESGKWHCMRGGPSDGALSGGQDAIVTLMQNPRHVQSARKPTVILVTAIFEGAIVPKLRKCFISSA